MVPVHLEVIEYLLIETVVTIQQGLHFAEEHAGFGALNDAVIVGASEHHHLADASMARVSSAAP